MLVRMASSSAGTPDAMVYDVSSGETPHDDEDDQPGSCRATASDAVLLDARSLADLGNYKMQLARMGAEERAARVFHLMECPQTGDSVQLQLCGAEDVAAAVH